MVLESVSSHDCEAKLTHAEQFDIYSVFAGRLCRTIDKCLNALRFLFENPGKDELSGMAVEFERENIGFGFDLFRIHSSPTRDIIIESSRFLIKIVRVTPEWISGQ